MPSPKLLFVTLTLLLLNNETKEQAQEEWVSPCPNLFVYEGNNNNDDRWYGNITLFSETGIEGISLQIIFDRPALQLGNWFGTVTTNDSKVFLIQNHQGVLKAHVPQSVRFYIKYEKNEPPPKLVSLRLNAMTVCPEAPTTSAQTVTNGSDVTSNGSGVVVRLGGSRPGGGNGGGGSGGGENFGNVEDLNEICGTVNPKPVPLIGEPTEEGGFPWHAALHYSKGIRVAFICAASLISKYHVITVAHCVTRRKSEAALNPDNLVVYLGKYYLDRFLGPKIQERQVSKIITHPQYQDRNYSNDIALVKFMNPAEITDSVRPVCLWKESTDLSSVLNKQGTIVGWDSDGKRSKILVKTKIPVVSQDMCLYSNPEFYSHFTSSNTYCAGFRNGTTCSTYIGAGMFFSNSDSKLNGVVWQLRGLTSIVKPVEDMCDTSYYTVFTDTAQYLDWIKKSMTM